MTNPRSLSDFVSYWSARANYTRANVSQDISVTGEVLPVRDVRDNDTAKQLRGEDVAWLLQNALLLERIWDYSDATERISSLDVTKTLQNSQLNELKDLLQTFCSSQRATRVQRFIGPGDYPELDGVPIDELCGLSQVLVQNKLAEKLGMTCDWMQTFSDGLVADKVRRLFYGCDRIKHLLCRVDYPSQESIQQSKVYLCAERYNWPGYSGMAYDREHRLVPISGDVYLIKTFEDSEYGVTSYRVANSSLNYKFRNIFTGHIKSVRAYYEFISSPRSARFTRSAYIPMRVNLEYVSTVEGCEVWKLPDWMMDTRNVDARIFAKSAELIGITSVDDIEFDNDSNLPCIVDLDVDSDLSGIGWNYSP